MSLWNSLGGTVTVRLTAADPAQALTALSAAHIQISDVRPHDEMTMQISLMRSDLLTAMHLAGKNGYELQVCGVDGLYWLCRRLIHRPVLLVGIGILFLISLYLPSRIFFIRVEGAKTVPVDLITEVCQNNGIQFCASRRKLRSEEIKNKLLDEIPQLQWVGVNTYGCTAVVSVKERADEDTKDERPPLCSIVAAYDGRITRIVVTKGNGVCAVGQSVREGQLLISGFLDCGILLKAGPAEGEVYAQTNRQTEVISPEKWTQKSVKTQSAKKYALIIGKKRINFYKGSGISGGSCDKMYAKYDLILPGNFTLPISVIQEVWTDYETQSVRITKEQANIMLSDYAGEYLRNQMIAGEILRSRERLTLQNGCYRLIGQYSCEEMIGKVRSEEIIKPHGKYE